MTRDEWKRRKGRSSSFVRRSLRFAIYARDRFTCVYCRRQMPTSGADLTLNHVLPRSHGGASTACNLATACGKCNFSMQANPDRLPPAAAHLGLRRIRANVRRALRRPINRELGRWLEAHARGVSL